MKLRNKKTGEIIDLDIASIKAQFGTISVIPLPMELGGDEYVYDSLAELTKEWEDAPEEPKEDYMRVINSFINYVEEADDSFVCDESVKKFVEKLKAWKRLKDAGFEFKGWKVLDHDSPHIYFNVYRKNSDDIVPFLDLLFGGEE